MCVTFLGRERIKLKEILLLKQTIRLGMEVDMMYENSNVFQLSCACMKGNFFFILLQQIPILIIYDRI